MTTTTRTGKFTPDPEIARQKMERAKALLDEAVAEIKSSEDFRRYLQVQARFHKYSFNNVLLILMQRPDATRVAGFGEWAKLRRFPRKGEKGITIIAPRKGKIREEQSDGSVSERVVLRGFTTATVFDVSQTEGEELPQAPQARRLESDTEAGRDLFARLMDYCDQEGIRVSYETLNGPNGYYQPATHSIVLDTTLTSDARTKTLLHEVVHSVLHRTTNKPTHEVEVEAEGTTFIVATAFDLDTTQYSVPYVATWQGNSDALLSSGATMQAAAKGLIERLSTIDIREAVAA